MKPLMQACEYRSSPKCRARDSKTGRNLCEHSVLHEHTSICDRGSDMCPKCKVADVEGMFDKEDFEI